MPFTRDVQEAELEKRLAETKAMLAEIDRMNAQLDAVNSKIDAVVQAELKGPKNIIKIFCRTGFILFLTIAAASPALPASLPLLIGSLSLAMGFALIPFAYHVSRESSWFNEKRKSSNENTSEKKETVANVSSALTTLHTPTVTEEVSSLEPVRSHSKIFAIPLSQPESTTQLTPRP